MDLNQGFSAQQIFERALPLLNKVHARRLDHIVDSTDISSQQKISMMNRMWAALPVLFGVLISYLCCISVHSVPQVVWLYDEHLRFQGLSQKDRNVEILSTLSSHWDCTSESVTQLTFRGNVVCEHCYRGFHSLSESSWIKRKEQASKGARNWEHGNCGRAVPFNDCGLASRDWLQDYFMSLGDWQPDTGQVHLPPIDKKDIHTEMKVEIGNKAISLSHFYHVWNAEFPNVVVPPAQRMGKCQECEDLHKKIMNTRDKTQLRILKEVRQKHIKSVIADRRVYHKWRVMARNNPDKYLVVILDGMDQSKTDIPNYNTGESPVQMTCRVVGALVHSARKEAYAYILSHFTKETNSMIEVLTRVLDSRPSLPPTLVLQLDNTWQENKNSRMFSYLASLVEAGVFEEIIVNFLPVGHTHVSVYSYTCACMYQSVYMS